MSFVERCVWTALICVFLGLIYLGQRDVQYQNTKMKRLCADALVTATASDSLKLYRIQPKCIP